MSVLERSDAEKGDLFLFQAMTIAPKQRPLVKKALLVAQVIVAQLALCYT